MLPLSVVTRPKMKPALTPDADSAVERATGGEVTAACSSSCSRALRAATRARRTSNTMAASATTAIFAFGMEVGRSRLTTEKYFTLNLQPRHDSFHTPRV